MMKAWTLGMLLLVLCGQTVEAQTNLSVLGTGRLSWDLGPETPALTLAEVQAREHRVYIPATATTGVLVVSTCLASATPGVFTCTTPLAPLPLTATYQSLALTTGIVVADGTAESAKATAPFSLRKVAPPVAPIVAAISIRP